MPISLYTKYSLYLKKMKSKSISFAEVLRKTARSPRVEPTPATLTLEELARRFENDPNEDYTLYLGHFNASQRSKPSSSRMGLSRNTAGNQEEMFDSWIQKQSTLGANKENIRNQPLRSNRNEPAKRSEVAYRKNITTSKAKQDFYPTNSANSHYQRQTARQYEEQQHTFPTLNIEMVKSNSYENEHAVNKCRSPKNENRMQTIQPPPPITAQYDRPKFTPSERPTQIRVEPTFKEIKQSKQSEKIQAQFSKVPERSNSFAKLPQQEPARQSFEPEQVKAEINDITSKYMNNYSPEQEQEDQELLLQNSLPLRAQEDDLAFDQTYAKKAQQQEEIMKKRMEDAKNMIGNYLDKLKKDREEQKKDEFYIMNPHYAGNQPINHSNNNMVGYSFSNNHQFMGVNQSAQNQPLAHPQTYIPDVVSEAPEETDQPMRDSLNFENKYLNLNSFQVEHNEHIPNIQSVKYEGEDNYHRNQYEEQRPFDIPNGTSKFQALSSKEREGHFADNYETRPFQPLQNVSKEEPYAKKSIQSFESNRLEAQNLMAKPLGKSKQKISLISSKSRSNKTSPSAINKEKEADVATTDFALSLPKQEKPQQTKIQQKTFLKPEDTKNAFKKVETYQFLTKAEETPSRPWQNNKFSTYITARQQTYITPLTTPQPKAQETRRHEYVAPSYATKPTSKFADITSDYYSTANYNPAPTYQTVNHYEAPSYANQTKNSFANGKNYEQLPLKLETPYEYNSPKEQTKKESSYSVPATNSYEQKYALPTSYGANNQKQPKKGYLSQLQIKQSITIDQPKTKQEPYATIKNTNTNFAYGNTSKQFKTVNPITSSRNSLKLSLKQSINVASSEEFVFDL